MQNIFSLSPFQIRLFWGTFIAVFSIVALQHLGISPMKLVRPIPEKEDVFNMLQPKLEEKKNIFRLKKNTSLIGQAHAGADYDNAHSYAVIDMQTGDVILENGLSDTEAIASLTKIMSAVVALDLASPDEYFTVTPQAQRQIPTKIGVVAGERMNLTELLHALLLTSANDSAEVIRNGIDTKYGQEVFIKAMNKKAAFLGLSHTHFTNPQGFDNTEHYSSAEDLAVLTHYAMTQYPLFADIVKKDYVFLPQNSEHKQFDLYNWNGLIGVYPNVSGVKIGSTGDAGKTTIVTAERGGKTLMVVLLGAPGVLKRDLWAAQLLDAGFEHTLNLPRVNVTEEQLRAKYSTWEYFN